MSERARIAVKTPEAKKESLASRAQNEDFSQSINPSVDHILFLQRTIGNQAVQRLIKSGALQAKLKIGRPGDKYEQEADRVADTVMRMPDPWVQRKCSKCDEELQRQAEDEEEEEPVQAKPLADQITSLVQRQEEEEEESVQAKPLSDQITPLVQRQDEEEEEPVQAKPLADQITPLVQKQEEEDEEPVQAKPLSDQITPLVQRQEEEEEETQAKELPGKTPTLSSDTETSIRNIKGSGQPLPESTRAFMEPQFGRDFSNVRIHKDSQADNLAQSVNAKAFTLKNDIVFKSGQYSPDTSDGKKLLAHELTHVVQQGNGRKVQPIQRDTIQLKKKKSKKCSKNWKYKVSATALWIHKGKNWKRRIKRYDLLSHGEKVCFYRRAERHGKYLWFRVYTLDRKKKITGWVASKYLTHTTEKLPKKEKKSWLGYYKGPEKNNSKDYVFAGISSDKGIKAILVKPGEVYKPPKGWDLDCFIKPDGSVIRFFGKLSYLGYNKYLTSMKAKKKLPLHLFFEIKEVKKRTTYKRKAGGGPYICKIPEWYYKTAHNSRYFTKPPISNGLKKYGYIGRNEQCAILVNWATGAPGTSHWKAGTLVTSDNISLISKGTALATFNKQGNYPKGKKHSFIYDSVGDKGIIALEQSSGRKIRFTNRMTWSKLKNYYGHKKSDQNKLSVHVIE